MQTLTDAELVLGIRDGDEGHFNELYARYFQRVYNFTFVRVRNHADTEEIVQETFTAVFRSVEAFRGQSSLLSWIYGIAKNTVNNHLRRLRTRDGWMENAEPELLRPVPSLSSCTPEEHLSLRRYADAISERLGAASDWQAEVFVLRHVENLSIPEISRRTARSSDAIRSCLYRMKRLFVEASQGGFVTVGP
ncbi:MAG: RNA polymerase sigma factor [Deltaproteobacteria bacterium]|nr:RNA polymerase sigma factor [Deltaproteobacteria bacterium]